MPLADWPVWTVLTLSRLSGTMNERFEEPRTFQLIWPGMAGRPVKST
jgi:hypothetical protein